MTGYELRLWRKGLFWNQERAANELDVNIRTYKRYEKRPDDSVPVKIDYATRTLSLIDMLPELAQLSQEAVISRLTTVLRPRVSADFDRE